MSQVIKQSFPVRDLVLVPVPEMKTLSEMALLGMARGQGPSSQLLALSHNNPDGCICGQT